MNEEYNNYDEPSTGSEIANMGRKTVGVVGNVGNLALGMGKGLAGNKKNDDKNDNKDKKDDNDKGDDGNSESGENSSLPKNDSLDSSDDVKDLGKNAVKAGGKLAKEGTKVIGKGVKALWKLIPFPWNFLLLGFLLIIVLVVAILTFSAANDNNCSYEAEVTYDYSCTQINLDGQLIDFEEYVIGVVSGESYAGQNIEAIKAQAVAARTYALMYTNDCQKKIISSQKAQVYNSNYRDDAREAVEATKGEVLTYNGNIFYSMYDSFNVKVGSCSGSKCSTTYTKLPNGETHTVSISSAYFEKANSGHGKGMSQVASYEMADNGSTYDEILEYFYSDGVQLANHINEECEKETTEADFAPRTAETGSLYNDSEALSDIRAAAPNVGYLLNISGLKYQCVTYARLRAVEILLTTSVYDESTRAKAISVINGNTHNGWGWYSGGISELGKFNGDNSCTEFKPGSLISFKGNGSRACCGSGYNGSCLCGHVAIVEDVDYDNETVRITDMYSSLYGQYHELTYSFAGLRSAYGGCLGTTYLLEYHG